MEPNEGYVAIRGKEKVYAFAKMSLHRQPVELKLPNSNFKPSRNKFLFIKWKSVWNNAILNTLNEINP